VGPSHTGNGRTKLDKRLLQIAHFTPAKFSKVPLDSGLQSQSLRCDRNPALAYLVAVE
jgi:hypothetical protein